MRARGFLRARLYTPSAHVRARRFYERRGWLAQDELWNPELKLVLAEYRLMLAPADPQTRRSSSRPVEKEATHAGRNRAV
jgi:hypothetical protein